MWNDPFQRKTYGRIFVQKQEDVAEVEQTIREVDEFEFGYMPKNLIVVYDPIGPNLLTYLHKFEMSKIALTQACLKKGIWIWCVDNGTELDTL